MKIALITDTHFGARADSLIFNNYFWRFFNEVFFPYLEQNNIKQIIHLGDIWDRRKYINFQILNFCRKNFFEKLNQEYQTIIIQGNHDVYFKEINDVSGLTEALIHYKNIEIIDRPIIREFDGTNILLIPWMNQSNEELCLETIKTTNAEIMLGHFDIIGFEMYRGLINNEAGLTREMFNKFDMVLSGHYHHKSTQENISYLGTPYEIIWSDYNDPKGFHIFDTSTRELEFIQNPFKLFHKVRYDDENKSFEDLIAGGFSKYKDCYVKVIIDKKTNQNLFDQFIEELYKDNPADVTIIDAVSYNDSENNKIDETKDTLTLLIEYVDSLNLLDEAKRKSLIELLKNVYLESLSVEQ